MPETLFKAKLFPANWAMKLILSLVKMFIDKRTMEKVEFLNTKEEAFKDIDKRYVPKIYGGDLEINFKWMNPEF